MKIIISILTFLIIASTSIAAEKVQVLTGIWESQRGALYQSDGTNFICFYIPEKHMEKFGHWKDKNALTDIKETALGIEAKQFLRYPDGRTKTTPTQITIKNNNLTLYFHVPGKEELMNVTFTRRPEED